jgi:hypothetical protein
MLYKKIFNFFIKSNMYVPELIVPYIKKNKYNHVNKHFTFSKQDITYSLKTSQTEYKIMDWKKYPTLNINLLKKEQLLSKLNI